MRSRLAIPALFTLVSLIILVGLGAWQWRRMGEKETLLATIRDRLAEAAMPVPANWSSVSLGALSYRPVVASGRFDHGREAHVFFSLSRPVGGVSGPGYLVITPFVLEDGRTVLVNRGFVPQDKKLPQTRAAGQIEGAVSITGLIRMPEARGAFSGADDPSRNIFYVRDPDALARARGIGPVAPFLIDLKTPPPPGGLPVPSVTQVDIPNNHFQYALTWWSLAGVLVIIFGLFVRQRQE